MSDMSLNVRAMEEENNNKEHQSLPDEEDSTVMNCDDEVEFLFSRENQQADDMVELECDRISIDSYKIKPYLGKVVFSTKKITFTVTFPNEVAAGNQLSFIETGCLTEAIVCYQNVWDVRVLSLSLRSTAKKIFKNLPIPEDLDPSSESKDRIVFLLESSEGSKAKELVSILERLQQTVAGFSFSQIWGDPAISMISKSFPEAMVGPINLSSSDGTDASTDVSVEVIDDEETTSTDESVEITDDEETTSTDVLVTNDLVRVSSLIFTEKARFRLKVPVLTVIVGTLRSLVRNDEITLTNTSISFAMPRLRDGRHVEMKIELADLTSLCTQVRRNLQKLFFSTNQRAAQTFRNLLNMNPNIDQYYDPESKYPRQVKMGFTFASDNENWKTALTFFFDEPCQ